MGARADRQQLIIRNIGFARTIARAFIRRAAECHSDQYESAAMEGLVRAANSWNPERGATFRTWAGHRIRGAILDFQRSGDTVTRHYKAEARHGRPVDPARLERVRFLSGEAILAIEDGAKIRGRAFESIAAPAPDMDPVERLEIWDRLFWGLARLNNSEAYALFGYFVLGRKLADIGRSLGVTESRACQLYQEAIVKLRPAFEDLRPSN